MIKGRDILIYLSIVYGGDWTSIYTAVTARKHLEVDTETIEYTINSLKCKAITILDEGYPKILKQIYQAPFVLFYYGDISLLNSSCVAVVGSRNCTKYGREATDKIVKDLSPYVTIVSGMAKGIDAHAHECALKNKGKTIAVLGSGIDNCYPLENEELYENIKEKGLIISEFPNMTPPDSFNFPTRNRIISGLSLGVVVVESKSRSGTSITVNFALAQNREVMCVPHQITSESNCNLLIKEGAVLVENGLDVLENVGIKISENN